MGTFIEEIERLEERYPEIPVFIISAIAVDMTEWQRKHMLENGISGVVQEDYQIRLSDGSYIDLDPSMQNKTVFDVHKKDNVRVLVIKDKD